MAKTMIKQILMLTAVLLVIAVAQASWAQGSVSRDDIMPILDQQPAIATLVANSLDLDETGDAMRIGNDVNPNLGGMRVGPYVILAKPKGAPGDFTLELTVDTEMNTMDDAGNPVDFEKATKIEEIFTSITIRPVTP